MGVIAYAGDEPIGWCAVAPRSAFTRLERARTLRPIDDRPVRSIVCIFVAQSHRQKGVSVSLLRGAAAYAKSLGARVVEGYPVKPRSGTIPAVFAHPGIPSAFRQRSAPRALPRSRARRPRGRSCGAS